MAPYDRISIVRLRDKAPQSNRPIFSMCRPRTGDPNSPYPADKHNWLKESAMELEMVFNRFTEKLNNVLTNESINAPIPTHAEDKTSIVCRSLKKSKTTGEYWYSMCSPIMETLKEISRLADFDFDDFSNYPHRKLIIVSDFYQSTPRIPFYDRCNIGKNKNCPEYKKFKGDKEIKKWLPRTLPEFGENIEVQFFYLNSKSDPNLDRGVTEFWEEYFMDSGIDSFDNYVLESDG